MDPAVVVSMVGIASPVVVEHADLIAHPDQRYSAVPEDRSVQHDDTSNGNVDISRVVGFQGRFQPSQAR